MRAGLTQRLYTTPRVDWFAVLIDLNRKGLTTVGIAQTIGTPRSTVLGWKQGGEPNHADGERLVALWLRMTEQPRDRLPMTHCPEWLTR